MPLLKRHNYSKCSTSSYRSMPSIGSSPASRVLNLSSAFGITDINFGWVEECTSTVVQQYASFKVTQCAGSVSAVTTVSSNAAPKTSAASSVSALSVASVPSAAAASSTAKLQITYYTFQTDNVVNYQYRAYDGDATGKTIDYCDSVNPIAFVNLPNTSGDPSELPTEQLKYFSTHGIQKCTYKSPDSRQAVTLTCPGWHNPVQCSKVEGDDAKQHPCPGGGTEHNCVWGANL